MSKILTKVLEKVSFFNLHFLFQLNLPVKAGNFASEKINKLTKEYESGS